MRMNEFRAWDNKLNKMCLFDLTNSAPYVFLGLPIMQYTGLKDKEGVKIFEGDIVNNMYGTYEGVVQLGQYQTIPQNKHDRPPRAIGWHVGNESLENMCWNIDANYQMIRTNNIEVIGNIYENPELLENKDD